MIRWTWDMLIINIFKIIIGVVLFLFLSSLRMREGYETNNEEKIKNKIKPASVKESTLHLRLLHLGSTTPLDNHL